MVGQLAIDFGNTYTVAAYWRQSSRQVETLYLPGVTRPISGSTAGKGKSVYAAPSLIAYGAATMGCLIGQEAVEGVSGLVDGLFRNLRFDVVTGKQVYNLVGNRRLSGQDMARDYLAAVISRAGQALGLGNEAVIAFTIPMAACQSELTWQRYRRWLEGTVKQAGFNRLELVEEPWAVAWGAGMQVKPDDVYIVVSINADTIEVGMMQAANKAGDNSNKQHVRVLSHRCGWLADLETDAEPELQLTMIVKQVLRESALLGYTKSNLAGIVVIGSAVKSDMLAMVRNLFPGIPVHDKQLLAAAACGAAVLAAGMDGSGYLRYSYGLRYLAEDGYHYRELVPSGLFYPSDRQVAEFTIKASYDGQQEFALFIYRLEDGGQCVNEDSPLLLISRVPAAVQGQSVIEVKASLDGIAQLVVTAQEIGNGYVIADNIIAAKLV